MTTPAPAQALPQTAAVKRSNRALYVVATIVMLVTTVPYIYGWSIEGTTPQRGWYSGFGYNVSDSCVYTAWMRHISEGHFFQRNLFTTGEQSGLMFNLFYVVLGFLTWVTHLPPAIVYHAVRVILGIVFLRAVWWLLEMLIPQRRVRWIALFTVIFSSGLGWMTKAFDGEMWLAFSAANDLWMPESITFLCLYWSPFFLIALLMMVGVIGFLYLAEERRSWRHAVYAGLCALVLGNIHTYDIVALAITWGSFLVVRALLRWRVGMAELRSLGRGAIVAGLAAISVSYIAYLLFTDPAFRSRADVATMSPPPKVYAMGYGLTALLALAAIVLAVRWRLTKIDAAIPGGKPARVRVSLAEKLGVTNHGMILLAVWVVSNFVAAYMPVSFQRKMLMGTHIPMAALAGVALAYIIRPLPKIAAGAVAAVVIAALSLSNVWFLYNDMRDIERNATDYNTVRLFLYPGEVAALEWLGKNTPPDTVIQPLPWVQALPPAAYKPRDALNALDQRDRNNRLMVETTPDLRMYGRGNVPAYVVLGNERIGPHYAAVFDTSAACFAPTIAGRPVHVGHIGESGVYYSPLIWRWGQFATAQWTDAQRLAWLQATGVKYIIFSQKRDETGSAFTEQALLTPLRRTPPSYLRRVEAASNADADVYEVVLPR
jgi:hypothetical protein